MFENLSRHHVKLLLGCSLSTVLVLIGGAVLLLGVVVSYAILSDKPVDAIEGDAIAVSTVMVTASETPSSAFPPSATPRVVAALPVSTDAPTTTPLPPTATFAPSPTRFPSPTTTPFGTPAETEAAPTEVAEAAAAPSDPVITDQVTCQAHTASEAYANVRQYPTRDSPVISYIEPGRLERVIAFSREPDGTWYGVPSGWVFSSVIDVTGSSCRSLPDASSVQWNLSLGHVDHQLRNYRLVTDIDVKEYMLKYPMLVFSNGTIWYNPKFQ
jgi:hypothetical protein